jgi:hypothetical protein
MLRTGQLPAPLRGGLPPPRRPDLAQRRECCYRGPWRLPGPDSHRLAAVSLALGYTLVPPFVTPAPELLDAHSGGIRSVLSSQAADAADCRPEPRRFGPGGAASSSGRGPSGQWCKARASVQSERCCRDRHDHSVPALWRVSQKVARIWLAPQALGSIRPQYHRSRSGGRAAGWVGSPAARPWPRKRACTSATSA